MKTAIIGANGFLGRNLIDNLDQKGEDVLAVFNRNKSNIPAHIEAVSLQKFLKGKQKIDNIIFAAGSFKNLIEENVFLNCEVLYPITTTYSNCRVAFVSSSNVYGNNPEVIRENSSFYNPTAYGMSKLCGEFIVSRMNSYTIIRLVYLYGKGLENGSFLPFIIDRATTENGIKLFGKGLREQDYLHVEDAAELCIKALFKNTNAIYLGATGNPIKNIEVSKIVSKEAEGSMKIDLVEQEEKRSSFYFDPSWTKETLDWQPQKNFENGLKDMMS